MSIDTNHTNFQGKLIVFTAPSGAGKTTLVRHLLDKYPDQLSFSVSATTREKRSYETDGIDYYFLSPSAFRDKIENNEFVEWEEVYDEQFYGTLKSEIERLWEEKKHIIFDIDVQGAATIKNLYGDCCLTIFVQPPSIESLLERLNNRKSDSPENISRRIAKATKELQWSDKFDESLLNDDLPKAKERAETLFQQFCLGQSAVKGC